MTEAEIAEGLRSGEPAAFRALYEQLGSSVFAYLTRMTGRRELAEELTQETFLTAIRKIGFYVHRGEGGLRSWIFRIATFATLDVLRRERKMTITDEVPEKVDGSDPLAELERLEFTESVNEALGGLTPAQRMFLVLKEQEGMSCMEISRICGLSENAIKQGLFRARAALRRRLVTV